MLNAYLQLTILCWLRSVYNFRFVDRAVLNREG